MSVRRHDAYGLPVTTSCVSALESYARGVEGLLGWRADALEQFRAALARDPALALAHAGAAVCLFLEERFAEARAAAAAPRAGAGARAGPRGGARAPRRRQARRRRARDARAPRRAPARPRDPAAPVLRLVLAGAVPGDARVHDGRDAPLPRP